MAHLRSGKSFTLVEMLLATVIIAIALCGILAAYVGCFGLFAVSKNVSIAANAAQGLMEQIRNTSLSQIIDNYADLNFTVNNIPLNRGVVYVCDDPSCCSVCNPELLQVTISVCWTQSNRVFGEDKNLNGLLDAGEDLSPYNNIIDSPVQLVTLVANR